MRIVPLRSFYGLQNMPKSVFGRGSARITTLSGPSSRLGMIPHPTRHTDPPSALTNRHASPSQNSNQIYAYTRDWHRLVLRIRIDVGSVLGHGANERGYCIMHAPYQSVCIPYHTSLYVIYCCWRCGQRGSIPAPVIPHWIGLKSYCREASDATALAGFAMTTTSRRLRRSRTVSAGPKPTLSSGETIKEF